MGWAEVMHDHYNKCHAILDLQLNNARIRCKLPDIEEYYPD